MNSKSQHIECQGTRGTLIVEVLDQQLNDYDQVAELRDEVLAAMMRSDAEGVVLDLRNVEFLTSVALFPFIDIHSTAQRLGRQVVLCNTSLPVAQALTVSQLLVETRSSAQHLVQAENINAAIEWLERSTVVPESV